MNIDVLLFIFGQIPFEEIYIDKEEKHGVYCDRYLKSKGKKEANKINEELLYCGTYKEFIFSECRPNHDKDKESQKTLVPKSKIRYTCLEHGIAFNGFCFTCLISICKNCKRHEKYCKKLFETFLLIKIFWIIINIIQVIMIIIFLASKEVMGLTKINLQNLNKDINYSLIWQHI